MQPIKLHEHARDPKYHNRDRDIETAIAWSTIRSVLRDHNQEIIFDYIQSVRVSEKSITIKTEKPLINTELGLYREEIMDRIATSLEPYLGRRLVRTLRFA